MNQRWIVKLIIPAVLLLLPAAAMAQAPAGAAQTEPAPAAPAVLKVAWLNLEQAIFTCEEGKKEFGEVQKYVEKKNAELEALRKEVDTMRNQLNVQRDKLNPDALADLEDQFEDKETQLQRFQQDTQKDIDGRRVRATNQIGRKMLPVIEKIARDRGFSAVVYINPSRDAWVDPSLIITEDVIKAYNVAHPGSGPAAGAARRP